MALCRPNSKAGQGKETNGKPGDVSIAQLLICAMLGNVDLLLSGAANGRQDWISFLPDNVAAEAFEWGIAFAIVALVGPVGWLYYAIRIAFGFFNIRNHGKTLGQDMALQSKNVMVQELKNSQNKVIMEMERHVNNTLGSNANKVAQGVRDQLAQKKKGLHRFVERRKQAGFDGQAELARLQSDETSLLLSIQRLGRRLQAAEYTAESILSYAVQSIRK